LNNNMKLIMENWREYSGQEGSYPLNESQLDATALYELHDRQLDEELRALLQEGRVGDWIAERVIPFIQKMWQKVASLAKKSFVMATKLLNGALGKISAFKESHPMMFKALTVLIFTMIVVVASTGVAQADITGIEPKDLETLTGILDTGVDTLMKRAIEEPNADQLLDKAAALKNAVIEIKEAHLADDQVAFKDLVSRLPKLGQEMMDYGQSVFDKILDARRAGGDAGASATRELNSLQQLGQKILSALTRYN